MSTKEDLVFSVEQYLEDGYTITDLLTEIGYCIRNYQLRREKAESEVDNGNDTTNTGSN